MLDLSNVTLVAMTSIRLESHVKALQYSKKGIKFYDVKLLSDTKPENLPSDLSFEYTEKSPDIDSWCYNVIYNLPKYIHSEYMILIQDNGFIVNPSSWKEEFLNYDYIGAPWPLPIDDFSYRDINGNIVRIGNSVSLRSKKLLDLPLKLGLKWEPFHGFYHEDGFICAQYRHIYEEQGCNFPSIDIAKYFSRETELDENINLEPFAFHNYAGANSKYPKFY